MLQIRYETNENNLYFDDSAQKSISYTNINMNLLIVITRGVTVDVFILSGTALSGQ